MTVTLDDGGILDADLLIGADGIHSAVRELVFGPEEEFFHYLGFQVGAYSFHDPGLAARIGDRLAVTDTRNEAMFFYRLRDGTVTAMAVHRAGNPILPADPQALLRSRYRGLGWICPAALDHCPHEIYYDQVAQIQDDPLACGTGAPARRCGCCRVAAGGTRRLPSGWPPHTCWRRNLKSSRRSAVPSQPSKHAYVR